MRLRKIPGFGAMVQTDAVFQFARQRRFDRRGGSVAQRELQNRRGQAGVVSVQRDERRKRLELHRQRHGGIGVFHDADRIFAAKRDVGKTVAVQRAGRLADLERKPLRQRRAREERFGIMFGARTLLPVENVPVPEPPVAAKIKLTRPDAADRQAHVLEFAAAQHFRRAAREQRLDPFGRQFLVGGHQMFKILARERPGHRRAPRI